MIKIRKKHRPRKCQLLKCRTPWCNNQVSSYLDSQNKKKKYCADCIKEHDITVLELQTYHSKPIKELVMSTAQMFNFKSMSAIADYFESQIPIVRYIIKKYYGLEWDDFKRVNYCKVETCEKVDVSHIKNKYYLSDKIKNKKVCNCLNKDGISLNILLKNDNDIEVVEKILREA